MNCFVEEFLGVINNMMTVRFLMSEIIDKRKDMEQILQSMKEDKNASQAARLFYRAFAHNNDDDFRLTEEFIDMLVLSRRSFDLQTCLCVHHGSAKPRSIQSAKDLREGDRYFSPWDHTLKIHRTPCFDSNGDSLPPPELVYWFRTEGMMLKRCFEHDFEKNTINSIHS